MRFKILLGLALLAMLVASAVTVLAAITPFSADYVQIDNKNKETIGRIFVTQDKMRSEFSDAKTGLTVMIVRMDRKVTWMLMTREQTYMEIKYEDGMGQVAAQAEDTIESKQDLGVETLNGYICHKWKFIYKNHDYGTSIVWISDKLSYAIQTQATNKYGTSGTEMRSIKEGPQAASLFEIPAGYEKFEMPDLSGLLGGG